MLLILILLIGFSAASPDQFVFNVTLTCNHVDNYRYKIQFVEWDWWLFNGDDIITKEKTGIATPGSFNMMIVGMLPGDELTSEGYDVRMLLTHSCTRLRNEAKVYSRINPLCEIGKGICHFRISQDITDLQGEINNYANLVYK